MNIKPIAECYINLNKLFRSDFHSVDYIDILTNIFYLV